MTRNSHDVDMASIEHVFLGCIYLRFKYHIQTVPQGLGSCGFQWCVFHSCKNSPNIQLVGFSLNNWRNYFAHVFWVTNDLSTAYGFCRFLTDLKNCTSLGPSVIIFSYNCFGSHMDSDSNMKLKVKIFFAGYFASEWWIT